MTPILLTLPLALLPALVSADCTIFAPGAQYTTVSNNTIPLSDGQTCIGPKKCWYTSINNGGAINITEYNVYPIAMGGIITASPTLDYDTTPADKTSLLNLIAVNTDFKPQTISYNETGGYGFGRDVGTSGYVGFTPHMTCYNGTVSGCSGDGFPMNGTVITGCTPQGSTGPSCTTTGQLPNGDACLQGTISWVTTDEATANGTSAPSEHVNAAAIRKADAALIAAAAGVAIAFII